MYRNVFEEFYRYLGTDIPQKQVFDIKVDILTSKTGQLKYS